MLLLLIAVVTVLMMGLVLVLLSATAGATSSKVRNPLLDIALRDFNGDFLPFLMMQLGTAQLSVGGSGCNVGLVDSSRDDLA